MTMWTWSKLPTLCTSLIRYNTTLYFQPYTRHYDSTAILNIDVVSRKFVKNVLWQSSVFCFDSIKSRNSSSGKKFSVMYNICSVKYRTNQKKWKMYFSRISQTNLLFSSLTRSADLSGPSCGFVKWVKQQFVSIIENSLYLFWVHYVHFLDVIWGSTFWPQHFVLRNL